MAKNQFAKARPITDPYAIFVCGDLTWHVVKTYKLPHREDIDAHARWQVAGKSDATGGSFEIGDMYRAEVERYGRLVAATPDWCAVYGIMRSVPTPSEHMQQEASA